MKVLLAPTIFIASITLSSLALSGCTAITESASKAFDSANSVIASGEPVLWISPEEQATPPAKKSR